MFDPAPAISLADSYTTPPDRRRSLVATLLPPTLAWHWYVARTVFQARAVVALGRYDDARWIRSSQDFHRFIEAMGTRVEVTGMQHLRAAGRAAVIVGNHMSTLETFLLPGIINPVLPCTFIVKPQLLRTPVVRAVFRAVKLIGLTYDNPRRDLESALTEGGAALERGRSVIVFPQGSRMTSFDRSSFNSLGIKLARRGNVPVIPLALKTDAWALGRRLKDVGRYHPRRPVRVAFGAPLAIGGRGAEEHEAVVSFITEHVDRWRSEDGA